LTVRSDLHDLDNLGDPDKDVAISCSSRFVTRLYDHLDPQFTGVCHLLIKLNTENNHICIRSFDNDPALLSQFFEPFVTTSSFFGNGKKLVYKILKDAASDFHDLDNLGDPDKDVAISCSSRFVARLYDQKSFAS
jgi:hypothetical protein